MDNIVRGCNWYFAQLNVWRVLDEVTLPELTFQTEDFTPGGHMMGVAWPEDMQPLKAGIKLKSDDPRTFAEALGVNEEAQKTGRDVKSMDLFAAMTGLSAPAIRGMEATDADRVTKACLPFLPLTEEDRASP
jgi:phage tail tube protein FII